MHIIHDEVDNSMIGVIKGSTLHNIKSWSLMVVYTSAVHFLRDVLNTFKSEPARPSLGPLSTNYPCLTWLAWGT